MKKDLILVVGASGTVGTELVRLLRSEGHDVRATTNKTPTDQGSVKVDLSTGEGVKAAFDGVEKAFFLSPPGYADQYAMVAPLIQEAKRRGLKKIVLMSAMGANASEDTPFRRAEIDLEKSGLNYNIVRPNWFMQNFNTFWIQGILEQGKILLPAGTAKTSFIDAKDISAVIAKLLTTETFSGKAFDITGPTALTHDEVAEEISKVTGKQITYQDISPSDFRKALLGAGLPAGYTEFLIAIMGFLREGYSARTTTSVREILGREPGDFRQYAQAFKASWSK